MNATWSERDRVWLTNDKALKVRLKLTGPSAAAFARQPGRMFRFVNQKLTGESKPSQGELSIDIPAGDTHNVSFNWRSDYGAVAANTIRIRRASPGDRSPAAKGSAK